MSVPKFEETASRILMKAASITAIHNGNTGIAVWGVAIWGPTGKSLYNTLVTITVNETGPHIERTVPEFIQVTAALPLPHLSVSC